MSERPFLTSVVLPCLNERESIAGCVTEQHAAREGMFADVAEPFLDGVAEPSDERLATRGMAKPDFAEPAVVQIDELGVDVGLRLEMVVEHRDRNAGASGDLLDAGPLVPALGEHGVGRVDEETPPLRGGHSFAHSGRLGHNLVKTRL